jgi:N-acetylglucosamine transport system substrate-binding protein
MTKISRRSFLKASALAATGVVLSSRGLRAFAQGSGTLPFPVAPEAVNPLNISAAHVEAIIFEGGYGSDYAKNAAAWMEQLHPGVKVSLTGMQKVGEVLRPRFVAGNPPDVVDNAGSGNLDLAAMYSEGQCADLTDLLEAPSLDTPGKKFKDTLIPGSQADGVFEGKQAYLNLTYSVSGICYSKPTFDKAGWTYPKTWDEMVTLCDQIKKDGKMAPWTYQGKYPGYVWDIMLFPLIYYAGGPDLLVRIDNLDPTAWKDPAVLMAAEALYTLYDKGWLLEGTAGMDHTASQTAFFQGKAAFIPDGTWLENEMKTVIPAGFDVVYARVPGFKDGKGDLKAASANGGEQYFVPAKAKNVKPGMEFLRILLSKNSAKWFGENTKSIMAVAGALEGAKVTPGMQSAIDVGTSSGGLSIRRFVDHWYKPIGDALENNTGLILTGKIKPADFVAAIQKAADAVASDPDVKKYQRTAY